MNGMIGWSGTFNLPFEMVIFLPPAGICTCIGFASDIIAPINTAAMLACAAGDQALRTLTSTPAQDGFRMPAEFERHSGCWMLWPERPDNWRAGAKPAQAAFAAIAAAIAGAEPVSVGVSAAQFQNARARLPREVRGVEISSNDAWIRDCGPTFVIDGKGRRRGVDWTFNAWGGLDGGLYFPWDRDDEVAQKVLEIEGADRYRTSFVLEGGAIHVDGQGTCLTTEECLLNPNRNPDCTRAEVEEQLRRYLGIRHVIWLGKGRYRGEAGGRIDQLACFVSPGHVALTWTTDRDDPQYEISHDAYDRLRTAPHTRRHGPPRRQLESTSVTAATRARPAIACPRRTSIFISRINASSCRYTTST